MISRSYLYVPGDAGGRLDRSTTRGADAVIADLEDAVAPSRRRSARHAVAAWLRTPSTEDVQRWVRINAGADGLDDLRTIYSGHLHGIVLPKVHSTEDVQLVAEALRALDTAGPPDRDQGVVVMALIETARSLRDVHDIAEHPVVQILQIGELDLAADLAVEPSVDETELLYARSRVVTASAAAGIEPPVAAVSPDISDLTSYRTSTERMKRLGFIGRALIHPAQIPVVHQAFTPSPGDVTAARRILTAYEAATHAGVGVIVDDEGRMVDEAVVRASRRTIALARKLPHTMTGQ